MTEVEYYRKVPGLENIRISPETWPDKNLKIQPGDLR